MKKAVLYKACVLLVLSFQYSVSYGQLIKIKERKDLHDANEIHQAISDSILSRGPFVNAIVYSAGVIDFFLIKDSLHWKGFILRNTEGPVPVGDRVDEYGNIEKSIIVVLLTFDGDSLYRYLSARNIFGLKQYSDIEISNLYSKRKGKKTGVNYAFGYSSHPNELILTTYKNSKKKELRYEFASTVDVKELHFIPTIKTLYLLNKLLREVNF